ncbi:Vacuolar protein-sorting-associated protein 27 [Coemansia sp. RSA 1933]|nr:Vacuolar protein-sorting-associated protein 27 [Coemansia sp. RSA 1933]
MVMRFIYGSPIDDEVKRLAAEDVPGHELDMSDALNFIDRVRSKEYSAKEVARVLRERLNFENPNVQILVLQLSDMCIKNGGNLIQLELTRREFIDAVYGLMESKTGRSFELRHLVLKLIQEWAELFRNNPEMAYVDGIYVRMKRMGYSFPRAEISSTGAMVDSASAPEWEDSPVCQRCRTPFTLTNRKHHCRHCGKCFCNDCSSNTTSIPKFAIYDSVRVCHGCYLRLKKIVPDSDATPKDEPYAPRRSSSARPSAAPAISTPTVDDNDEDLKRAIELSIQEAQHKPNYADFSLNPRIVGNAVPSSQTQSVQTTTPPSQSLYPLLNAPSQPPANMYPEIKNEPYPLTSAPTSNPQAIGEDDMDDPDLRAAIEASLQDVPGGGASGSDVRVPDYLPATSSAVPVGQRFVKEESSEDNAPLSAFMPPAKITEEEDSGPLTNTERENVQLFESLLLRIRDSGQDIKNDPQVQYLHESIDQLRPKITDAIDVVDQKQNEFTKLHHRIITATKIYEQLLDKRLRSSTYTNASSVPVSNALAYQNTQQSIYPTLSSVQQPPAYAPPAQTQYNPAYSAPHGQQEPQASHHQQHQQHQQPIQYNQFPEQQQQQHAHAAGNAPQGQYPSYNEPQQLSRSGSVYQQPQQQQQQLSPNNPFTASVSAYSAQPGQATAPAQLYNPPANGPAASSTVHQPQSSLIGLSSSTNAYYSAPTVDHIPSIPPLQPTSVRHVDSTQMSATSNADANAGANPVASAEPEEALLIEF